MGMTINRVAEKADWLDFLGKYVILEGQEILTMTMKEKPLTVDEATKPVRTEPSASVQAWNDEQTRQAVREADAGDFATTEELKATVRKYVPHG